MKTKIFYKWFFVTIICLGTQPLFAQLPKAILGSHKVISKANLDELVIQENEVVGKINGNTVVMYSYQKEENGFYYLERVRLQNNNPDIRHNKQKATHPAGERKPPEGAVLVSPNTIRVPNYLPNVKAKIFYLEEEKIKFEIHYLGRDGKVIKVQEMTVR